MEKKILLLGSPDLYCMCEEVTEDELDGMKALKEDLRDTLLAFRERYGVGQGVADTGGNQRRTYRRIGELGSL